ARVRRRAQEHDLAAPRRGGDLERKIDLRFDDHDRVGRRLDDRVDDLRERMRQLGPHHVSSGAHGSSAPNSSTSADFTAGGVAAGAAAGGAAGAAAVPGAGAVAAGAAPAAGPAGAAGAGTFAFELINWIAAESAKRSSGNASLRNSTLTCP